MDRTIVLDQHIIEAWGLWWAQWQKETKERLRRQAMSPQMRLNRFSELHLVAPKREGLSGDATPDSAVPASLLSK
jgi:hypothetical protein